MSSVETLGQAAAPAGRRVPDPMCGAVLSGEDPPMSRGWSSGSLDASGESRDFHVGDSEEVLWGWEGTEVLGLRRNGFYWASGS